MLSAEPIERFDAALRWAEAMADYMVHPIEVVPMISRDEYFNQLAVATGFEGIHARTDPAEQRAGRNLLVSMGVLQ